MVKRSYGFENNDDDDDTKTKTAATTTSAPEKSKTTADMAKAWWANLSMKTKARYQHQFANPNAPPTDDELIHVYDEDHLPATPERAKTWWNDLSLVEQKAIKDQHDNQPDDSELVTLYDEVHARDGVVENPAPSSIPTIQQATAGASATNPELMPNDAVPVIEVPLYAGMPRPPDAAKHAQERREAQAKEMTRPHA